MGPENSTPYARTFRPYQPRRGVPTKAQSCSDAAHRRDGRTRYAQIAFYRYRVRCCYCRFTRYCRQRLFRKWTSKTASANLRPTHPPTHQGCVPISVCRGRRPPVPSNGTVGTGNTHSGGETSVQLLWKTGGWGAALSVDGCAGLRRRRRPTVIVYGPTRKNQSSFY